MKPSQATCVLLSAAIFVLATIHSMSEMPDAIIRPVSTPRSSLMYPSIPLNVASTVVVDVSNILHVPNEAKIIVLLNRERTCTQPHLVGRISGRYLSKIEWRYDEANDDVINGYYSVPTPGSYFIEIIVTICQKFDLNTNATNICLVDPASNRLTHPNATINAELRTTDNETEKIGFWYNKDHIMGNSSVEPMLTRYQPQECRENNATLDRCKIHTDTSRYEPYEFMFNTKFDIHQHLMGENRRLCFLGASHSRVLTRFANVVGSHVHIVHIDLRFMSNLTRSQVQYASKCGVLVIGMGQWDASGRFHGDEPTAFIEFKQQLNLAMVEFVKPVMDANTSVFFRNMHYNPLGDLITACPPKDWRNPNVVDMYNSITKQLCKEFNIPFLDTTDITGIMWDRHADWAHFKDISGETEALYFLYRVFS